MRCLYMEKESVEERERIITDGGFDEFFKQRVSIAEIFKGRIVV